METAVETRAGMPRVIPWSHCAACGEPEHGSACVVANARLKLADKRHRLSTCGGCGVRFWQARRGRLARFCTRDCRRAWWNIARRV
jgi:hypothetical protein